jgi:hypothetical protein
VLGDVFFLSLIILSYYRSKKKKSQPHSQIPQTHKKTKIKEKNNSFSCGIDVRARAFGRLEVDEREKPLKSHPRLSLARWLTHHYFSITLFSRSSLH